MQGYSDKCQDRKTFWNGFTCALCPLKPGHELTPNCGCDDKGGRHDVPHKPCKNNSFNDGSRAECRPCTLCSTGYEVVTPCNSTTDTQCQERRQTTPVSLTEPTPSRNVSIFASSASPTNQGSSLTKTTAPSSSYSTSHGLPWAAPVAVFLSLIVFLMLAACIIYKKQKKGQHSLLSFSRSSLNNVGFSPLSAPAGNVYLQNILSPNILSAPLQTVLDDLDVVEELVILLDPEIHGVKNTKHLASHCNFPSTWITYTYSMKDSKSPLKTVLEGVTSRNPDWTVGHFAKLLSLMERNDAIAVLAKLRLNPMVV